MAIALKLGTVNKRVNSTLVPDATLWTNYDVVLKQGTSIEAPVFLLQGTAATFAGYNYAVGAGLLYGFYWIVDVVSVRDTVCEIHCVRDVLACNKTAITSQNAFIEYGFNTFDAGDSSTRVSDVRQTINKTPAQYSANIDITGGRISQPGIYIMHAVCKNYGVIPYVMNRGTLTRLLSRINEDTDQTIQTIENSGSSPDQQLVDLAKLDIRNSLIQEGAINAIQTCFWLPLTTPPGAIDQQYIFLGSYDTKILSAVLTSNEVYTATTTVTIPWPVNDWRRNNCQIVLYLPFMGSIPIPVDQVVNYSSLTVIWSVEFYGGNCAVTVAAGDYVLYTGNANLAAPIAVGRNAVDASAQVSGALTMAGGAIQMATGVIDAAAGAVGIIGQTATAGMFGGSGGQLTSGVNTYVSGASNIFSGYQQAVQPTITAVGSMGGLAGVGQPTNAKIAVMYYPPIDDAGFSAVYGHPVMKVATPAAGFCKTRGFSLASADRMGDIAKVNAAMDGGVFIE